MSQAQEFNDYNDHPTYVVKEAVISFNVSYVAEESEALRVQCIGNTEIWLDPNEFHRFKNWLLFMTTFEPCGFRAKRTGALTPNLDSAYEYGVRQPNGRRLTEEQWAAWVAENYEVVYREVK